jgi:hypothetical protein
MRVRGSLAGHLPLHQLRVDDATGTEAVDASNSSQLRTGGQAEAEILTAEIPPRQFAAVHRSRGLPMTPIDLKQQFGARYRVTYEESYFADRTRQTVADPWLMVIPCAAGHIFPWDHRLAYSANRRGPVASRVAALPGAEIVQDGDDGQNIAFPVEQFDAVAEIVRPRRRRRLSAEHREKLREAGKQFRFSPGSKRTPEAENGVSGGPVESEAVRA